MVAPQRMPPESIPCAVCATTGICTLKGVCETCGGWGRVDAPDEAAAQPWFRRLVCPACAGQGSPVGMCPYCRGHGGFYGGDPGQEHPHLTKYEGPTLREHFDREARIAERRLLYAVDSGR